MDYVDEAIVAATAVLTLALLYCLWRGWVVFRTRLPASATVIDPGYSEYDRQWDRFSASGYVLDMMFDVVSDIDLDRCVEDRVRFRDCEGVERKATVKRRVDRAERARRFYRVWYDPGNPEDAVKSGPGRWIARGVACGGGLAAIFYLGAKMTGGTL